MCRPRGPPRSWHIYSIVARCWLRAKKLLLNALAQIAETRSGEKFYVFIMGQHLATGPACDWWIDRTRLNYKFIVRDADFYILISAWAAWYFFESDPSNAFSVCLENWMQTLIRIDVEMNFEWKVWKTLPLERIFFHGMNYFVKPYNY